MVTFCLPAVEYAREIVKTFSNGLDSLSVTVRLGGINFMTVTTENDPSTKYASVLIVDDHPLYSDALAAALDVVFPECQVEKADCLGGAISLLEKGIHPELVLFDLKLPDVQGISGFVRLRSHLPSTPILVISSLASPELVQSLMEEGATGFLPKDSSASKIRAVLERIADGDCLLYTSPSPRDRQKSRMPSSA